MTTPKRTPVRVPEPARVLRRAELLTFKTLRTREAELTKDLAAVRAQVLSQEKTFISLLEAGATVEPGGPRVAIATAKGKRTVPWRQEYEKVAGKAAAQALLAACVPPTVKTLVVE